jgi:hypothetical protein
LVFAGLTLVLFSNIKTIPYTIKNTNEYDTLIIGTNKEYIKDATLININEPHTDCKAGYSFIIKYATIYTNEKDTNIENMLANNVILVNF